MPPKKQAPTPPVSTPSISRQDSSYRDVARQGSSEHIHYSNLKPDAQGFVDRGGENANRPKPVEEKDPGVQTSRTLQQGRTGRQATAEEFFRAQVHSNAEANRKEAQKRSRATRHPVPAHAGTPQASHPPVQSGPSQPAASYKDIAREAFRPDLVHGRGNEPQPTVKGELKKEFKKAADSVKHGAQVCKDKAMRLKAQVRGTASQGSNPEAGNDRDESTNSM
jgi:hypothetical protein